jgi:hypothetical protein
MSVSKNHLSHLISSLVLFCVCVCVKVGTSALSRDTSFTSDAWNEIASTRCQGHISFDKWWMDIARVHSCCVGSPAKCSSTKVDVRIRFISSNIAPFAAKYNNLAPKHSRGASQPDIIETYSSLGRFGGTAEKARTCVCDSPRLWSLLGQGKPTQSQIAATRTGART